MEARFLINSCGLCLISPKEYDEYVSALRDDLLRQASNSKPVNGEGLSPTFPTPLSPTFSAANSIEFRGKIKGVKGANNIASFPGKYGPSGWGRAVAEAKDEFLDMSVSCVFLPDPTSLGFGEHAMNPDTPSKCFCQSLYGERKPWGCVWFAEWVDNILHAVALDHKLQVYFFEGQNGVGKVSWGNLAEHGRLCDAILSGLSPEDQMKVRGTQQYPFDGLGGSQKGEVAWLDKKGYTYESSCVGDFLHGSKYTMQEANADVGGLCVASLHGSSVYVNFTVLFPLVRRELLNSAAVMFLPDSPYYSQHSRTCCCKELYGESGEQRRADGAQGCGWFDKWRHNIEDARARGQQLVVLFAGGMVGKGKVASWGECGPEAYKRNVFFRRRNLFLAGLSVAENERLASTRDERRDDFSGEKPGSERLDEEEKLFRASLTDEDNAYLDQQMGLSNSQKAEVAWLDHMGYQYTEIEAAVWAKDQRAAHAFLNDSALIEKQLNHANAINGFTRIDENAGYVSGKRIHQNAGIIQYLHPHHAGYSR
jgi:hypothetical protein